MKDRKFLIIISIVMVSMMMMSIQNWLKLKMIENQLSHLQGQLYSVDSSVNRVYGEIYWANERDRMIGQYNYTIDNINEAYEKALVKIDVHFNQLPNEANAYLMYRNIEAEDIQWNTVALIQQGGLNYAAEVELSYEENYGMQLVIESSIEKYSEELSTLNLKDQLNERITIITRPTRSDSTGNLAFFVSVHNYYDNKEIMKLKDLQAYVYYQEKIIKEINLLELGQLSPFGEPKTEFWEYEGNLKIPNVKDIDFMKEVIIEVIAMDHLGKEYRQSFDGRHW